MAKDMPDFSHLPVTIRSGGRTIEIGRDFVRVTETGLLGGEHWEEPLSAFTGILRRTDAVGGGDIYSNVHLVELVHPDTKKTLQLYQADAEEGIRKLWKKTDAEEGIHNLWKDAARALNLPALDETADGILAHEPEDLDKSIREVAADGKISVDFDADTPPPTGITWEQMEGELSVILGLRANSYASIVTMIVVGSPFILIAAWFLLSDAFGLFMLGIIAFVYVVGNTVYHVANEHVALVKRRIVITPRELRYFGARICKAIPLEKLESVRRIDDGLVIESDAEVISIQGLRGQQLRWLESFILATVARPSSIGN